MNLRSVVPRAPGTQAQGLFVERGTDSQAQVAPYSRFIKLAIDYRYWCTRVASCPGAS
jgi:hypothetical protein